MREDNVYCYPGENIDVTWDGRLCIHIAECGREEGELFVKGRNPWCMPDTTTPERVAEICERCPTGALTYSDNSGKSEQSPSENTINVTYNGPLFVYGELAIEEAPTDMTGVQFRAALCRCGQSGNKPFCDNSHLETGFSDSGAIGAIDPELADISGKLDIKPLTDGPLRLAGKVALITGSGRVAWQGENPVLCRCGESDNKPFCDGSHVSTGFRSD